MRSIEGSAPAWWWSPEYLDRSRALVLLGFTCPIPLSRRQACCALDSDDIVQTSRGLEVRLYQHAGRRTRYITLPADGNRELDVVQALLAWRAHLLDKGNRTGPLFVRINLRGRLSFNPVRLSARDIADLIKDICAEAHMSAPGIGPSTALPDFLDGVFPEKGDRTLSKQAYPISQYDRKRYL